MSDLKPQCEIFAAGGVQRIKTLLEYVPRHGQNTIMRLMTTLIVLTKCVITTLF